MKLLFDVGNSLIKWAYFSDGEIGSTASMPTADICTSALNDSFKDVDEPESVWISSVSSETILNILLDWCNDIYKIEPNVIQVSESSCGIDNNYLTQDTLGVDRWVAAIGARTVMPAGNIIIIDAGTAVTIDLLSDNNEFEGGAILPGFKLLHDSLTSNTAGIKSNYSATQKIVGRTTEECVNSGVSYGLVGAIERIVKEIQQEVIEPVAILITGGSAPTIKSMSKFEMLPQKNLVLLGVASVSFGGL